MVLFCVLVVDVVVEGIFRFCKFILFGMPCSLRTAIRILHRQFQWHIFHYTVYLARSILYCLLMSFGLWYKHLVGVVHSPANAEEKWLKESNNERNGNGNSRMEKRAMCDFLSRCGATAIIRITVKSQVKCKANRTEPNQINSNRSVSHRIVSYRSRKHWFSQASDNNVRLFEALRFNVQFIGFHA